MRSSIGVLVLCGGLSVAGVACSNHEVGRTTATSEASVQSENADAAVLDVVLADLLTRPNDSVISTGDPEQPGFFFTAETPSWPTKADRILTRHDKEAWAALTADQLRAAQEGAADVVRRYEAHDGVKAFQPADPRVAPWRGIADEEAPVRRHEFPKQPVRAYPPGYSHDGQFAVVALSVPWSIHHADATYLLGRQGDGRWVILLRQFVYYL
jgi:hypothetical protein